MGELEPKEDGRASLVRGLIERDPQAASRFHRQYARLISQLVWRLLGADSEHDDVVHQVYVNILGSIGSLRKPASLDSWVTGVAINTVRREIHRRKFRRLLHLVPDYQDRDLAAARPEKELALCRFYELLDRLGANERIVLLLHLMEGYSLGQIASLLHYSTPTAKRRFQAGKRRFLELAQTEPLLTQWVEELRHEP